MPTVQTNNRTFDARPDRIDLRDRTYAPLMESLPPVWPEMGFIQSSIESYSEVFVLDQGREGACTGFGLAAMINYLLWRRNEFQTTGLQSVSPRMLYHLARIYDEWPGEDYDGSSCRGAMKGWHRHGICTADLWPYRNPGGKPVFVKPHDGWREDAAQRPLGAYYRVNKDSISDMQAAVFEVGAIFCSARVHPGWFMGTTPKPVIIALSDELTGGHAFAIVGYTPDGFIVQNSWGPKWGYHGFAILSYEDWVLHGSDAWVAVLGAPLRTAVSSQTFRHVNLENTRGGKAGWFWSASRLGKGYTYKNPKVQPLSEAAAYCKTIVLGNNGRPLNKMIYAADAAAALKEVAYTAPLAALSNKTHPKMAIYAHGGLNDEKASIRRVRMMAPYFIANGIYPLFIAWKTGIVESIQGMIEDNLAQIFKSTPQMRKGDVLSSIADKLQEARDGAIEAACKRILVKSIWSEMKQNAQAAADTDGGVGLLTRHLKRLQRELSGLEVHLVGHSAGAILLGHLLRAWGRTARVASLSLFAPACTVAFANAHVIPAVERGVLSKAGIHVDLLDDEMERRDSVGPYGKSLLYLVSRALEDLHKTPLLGMACAWKACPNEDQWNASRGVQKELQKWRAFAHGQIAPMFHGASRADVGTGTGTIPLAHGSFDNDVQVIGDLIRRIRGKRLAAGIENLSGF